MLDLFLRIWIRSALPLFIKEIRIIGRETLRQPGPILFAANHPNSFLDAILVAAFTPHEVNYMSRGDAFNNPLARAILTKMHMMPVYRMRDGRGKLSLNDQTFEISQAVLERNANLLIFVEGFCINQTTLQLPLKKGAPRVVDVCWRKGLPVRVLPVWLQYSSFTKYPKRVEIRVGTFIDKLDNVDNTESPVVCNQINEYCKRQLQALEAEQQNLDIKPSTAKKILLAIPALLGGLLHAPLYLPVKFFIKKATAGSPHYDSALFAALLITYSIYLLTIGLLLAFSYGAVWFLLPFVVLPALARCYVVWR